MAAEGQLDLPKAVVKRIVKEKLAGVSESGKDVQLNKEALLAFAESAKVFISYVTAAANDVCKEKKRQTLSADDVFAALQELEFHELLPPLKESFDAYKKLTKEKKEKKAEISRKRKSSGQPAEGQEAAAADQAEGAADDTAADEAGGTAAGEAEGSGADDADEEQHQQQRDQDMQEADADAVTVADEE
eukprot:GHUV01007147.1.p1 GENE.GHUV01007147.1~~GHUV01007147.1.p1  ORF type:complete len:189 (+),score=95.30 GHUV01007147.1:141-707(+)